MVQSFDEKLQVSLLTATIIRLGMECSWMWLSNPAFLFHFIFLLSFFFIRWHSTLQAVGIMLDRVQSLCLQNHDLKNKLEIWKRTAMNLNEKGEYTLFSGFVNM